MRDATVDSLLIDISSRSIRSTMVLCCYAVLPILLYYDPQDDHPDSFYEADKARNEDITIHVPGMLH